MYDKIVNKTIKILFTCILCICIFIISVFAIPPAYAISSDNFEILYSASSPSTSSYVEGYTIYKTSLNINSPYGIVYKTYNDDTLPIYFFTYGTENKSSNFCLIVPSDLFNSYPTNDIVSVKCGGNGTYKRINSSWLTSQDNNFRYYTYAAPSDWDISEWYSPHYSTVAEGLEALDDYIITPSVSLYEGMNIPVGYIARIRVQNGSSFTMLTTMGTDNIAYRDSWVYTSQWYKFNDSSDPSTIMQTNGITIPWIRYGNTNILGQTNKAQYTINSTVGSYVWIYNPAYMIGQNADLYDTKLNSNIQLINVQNIDQVRIFALKSTYGYNGIVSSTSTGSGINYDPENGEWIDDNGDTVTPTEYGDTNVPATGTTIIQQLDNLLNNLINRIERLLVAPIDYINMLINAANNFFLWLRGLWSWLPGPVIESISAVLIIMCTVGALKLLWR